MKKQRKFRHGNKRPQLTERDLSLPADLVHPKRIQDLGRGEDDEPNPLTTYQTHWDLIAPAED